jgi:anti-sigma factor RsiW
MTEPHPHHQCIEMFAKLSEYLDQELDDISCHEIEKHAQTCQACEVCLATLRRTIALCKQMAPTPPIPTSVSSRLKQMIAKRG